VDISTVINIKTKAIKCHRSQINKFHRRGIKWIEGVVARAKYRGFESSTEYAEAFYVLRMKI